MRLAIIICACVLASVIGKAHAGTEVIKTEQMSFEQCNELIRRMAGQLGVAPINVVETSIMRIVRFPTNDGSGESILVTCSKPDRKMIVNRSW